ncbi:MAG TPA: TlpA disulfide reductase family protein [Verrucomicrobiae bacterium]|nr:TlpA disulfide reductase family protein [Verrucomicrobiae bacterium]
MFRSAFLHGVTAALVGSAVPSPLPLASPSPTARPNPLSLCHVNPTLPYDRPLELKMRVLDGPDFDLMRYRGYSVWLNIFATWCGPCNEEQPLVATLAEEYYDRGLRVIGMDCEEADDTVRLYRKRYGLTYPIAMDANGGFTNGLEMRGNTAFPGHLFFTPSGYLSCYRLGTMGERMMRFKINEIVSLRDTAPSPGPIPTRTPFPSPTPLASPSLKN